jgi:hypothetical protein
LGTFQNQIALHLSDSDLHVQQSQVQFAELEHYHLHLERAQQPNVASTSGA